MPKYYTIRHHIVKPDLVFGAENGRIYKDFMLLWDYIMLNSLIRNQILYPAELRARNEVFGVFAQI